jgi:hypothetical protein
LRSHTGENGFSIQPLRSRASRRDVAVYLLYGGLSIAFCSPLFVHPTGVGTLDWDQHLFYYAQVLKNVVEYAQAPFWSPWYCGGNVLWQNPQTALLSPVYPLTAIAGLPLAMKLNIVLHYWAGFIGMHLLLTRVAGVSFLPIVVYLASLFTLAGGHAMHVAVGHTVFLPAFYLPWIVYFLVRALQTQTIRPAFYGGAVLALMIYNGGLHIVWMAAPALAIFATALSVTLRDWRPIAVAIVVGVSGAAYAAPKLVPVVLYVASDRFWDARDPTARPDRMTPAMMLRAYVDPAQDIGSRVSATEQQHDWLEYGDYIGTLGAFLVTAAVIWFLTAARGADRQLKALGRSSAVTALLFLVWSAGEFSAFAPATLLRHVPFFSSFRIPSRLTIIVVFFGALAAAMFIRSIIDAIAWTTIARVAAAMICVVAVLQLVIVNRAHFRDKFSASPLDRSFRVLKGTGILVRDVFVNPYVANAPMLRALMNDQAVMWCYEVLQLKRGADSERPLVWTDGPAKITSVAFTPNRVQFSAIGGDARTRVFLNQNYAAGWRSDAGPVQLDPQAGGRMYVELAPGQTGRFAFAFSPPGLMVGVVGLILAVAVSAFAWHRRMP